MPSEPPSDQLLARKLVTTHSEVVGVGLNNLVIAANAWRTGRGLPSLPHEASAALPDAPVLTALVAPESLPSSVIKPQRGSRADAPREAATIAKGQADAAAIITRYHGQFGWIYNADNMSEMLDVHEPAQRWRHHDAVRSTASALTQIAFDWAMAQPVQEANATVLFTAGGNGSGKSTSIGSGIGGFGLDSTLSDVESSARNIDTALRSGRSVAVTFIYRAPIDAFLHGVVPRALDPRNGRPVTIQTHARTQTRAPETLLAIAERYRTEPRVSIHVIENTSGAPGKVRTLSWLREQAEGRPPEAELLRQLLRRVESDVPPAERQKFGNA